MNNIKTYYRRNLPHYQPPYAEYFVTFRLAGSLPVEVVERLIKERDEQMKYLATITNANKKIEEINTLRKNYFKKYEVLLDGCTFGPTWLREDAIANIVSQAIHAHIETQYDLYAYTIMPNHVHLVFSTIVRDESRFTINEGRDESRFTINEGRDESHLTANVVRNSSRKESPVTRDSSRDQMLPIHHETILDQCLTETRSTLPIVTELLKLIKGSSARSCNLVLNRTGAFWHHESYDHVIRNGEELERVIWYVLNNPAKARLVDSSEKWKWTYVKPEVDPRTPRTKVRVTP